MEATTEKKIVGARKPTRLREAEAERHVWMHTPASGITFEDVQKPDYWSHVAAQLRPCARIEVISEDMSWFGELLVLDSDRLWAKVAPLRFVELASREVPPEIAASGYEVAYKGPEKKHVVIRKSDKAIVQEGIARKADAEAWVTEHLKTLAR